MTIKNPPKLKVISGQRDELESALVRALFGSDQSQIDKLILELKQIGKKTPTLRLVNKDI